MKAEIDELKKCENVLDCPFNTQIKFRTIVGWLIGKRISVKFSYGKETSFFISSQIKGNKHWCTFNENEVYEYSLLNIKFKSNH